MHLDGLVLTLCVLAAPLPCGDHQGHPIKRACHWFFSDRRESHWSRLLEANFLNFRSLLRRSTGDSPSHPSNVLSSILGELTAAFFLYQSRRGTLFSLF